MVDISQLNVTDFSLSTELLLSSEEYPKNREGDISSVFFVNRNKR
jgi:hypothetical protein